MTINSVLIMFDTVICFYHIDPCSVVKCQHEAVCKTAADDAISCVCPAVQDCSSVHNVICASDGKSYLNECYLKVEICRIRKGIKIAHGGRCGKLMLNRRSVRAKISQRGIDAKIK